VARLCVCARVCVCSPPLPTMFLGWTGPNKLQACRLGFKRRWQQHSHRRCMSCQPLPRLLRPSPRWSNVLLRGQSDAAKRGRSAVPATLHVAPCWRRLLYVMRRHHSSCPSIVCHGCVARGGFNVKISHLSLPPIRHQFAGTTHEIRCVPLLVAAAFWSSRGPRPKRQRSTMRRYTATT